MTQNIFAQEQGYTFVNLSNNPSHLEKLVEKTLQTNHQQEFLSKDKSIILVERNSFQLKQLVRPLLPIYLGPDFETFDREFKPTLPFHFEYPEGLSYICEYRPEEPNGNFALSRLKCTHDYVEKIARKFAEFGSLKNGTSHHLLVEDLVGGKIICETYDHYLVYLEKTKAYLGAQDLSQPHFTILEREDYYTNLRYDHQGNVASLRQRRYNAHHFSLRLEGDSEIFAGFVGLKLEFKLLTLEDHQRNQHDPDYPERDHIEYKKRQLQKPHTFTDPSGHQYQLVVLDYHKPPSQLDQLRLVPREIDLTPFVVSNEKNPWERIIYTRLREEPLAA